jgi:hypothetical protein
MKKNHSFSVLFLLPALLISLIGYGQIAATSKEEFFKDWGYSPTAVFGLIKLDHPGQKSYYKIFKPNNESVKIQSYNAAGMLTGTTLVRFVNGKLNQKTYTNRWGDTYDITKYTVAGPDEFMINQKSTGENSYLPCKGARFIYRNNLLTEVRYISYDNKVIPNSDGVALKKYKRYTDKNRFSLVKEIAYYDVNGKPVISASEDCHKQIYEYDERGNNTSVAYYGTDNEPLTNRYGGFKSRYRYNENDQMVSSETIGINDEITKNTYGVAKTIYEYMNGFLSKATRFDERNNITKASDAGDGVAITRYSYDANGNQVSRSYFDETDNPMNNHSGYQKISYTYDPLDMLTASAYYDRYDSPVNNQSGVYKYTYVRDDKGNIIQKAYFDKTNTPVKDDLDQVYMMKYKYDDAGRLIVQSYWENSSTKMNRWNGYHETRIKYNPDGQETENILMDQHGNQFVNKSGYSRVVVNYNDKAEIAEYKYYNNNMPAVLDSSFSNKFHSVKFYYDANGRESSLRYFDKTGLPVDAYIALGDGIDCHKVEFVYKGNSLIEQKIYGKNSDSPSKIIDCLKNDYILTSGLSRGYKNQ